MYKKYMMCCSCIMDTSDSTISFNESGECVYCSNYKKNILAEWQPNFSDVEYLERIGSMIRAQSNAGDYDCIIGVSGGLDSSYTAYIAKEVMKIKPLLFHVDAGWNTDQAVGNIEKISNGLSLDLYTEVVNWEEMKDLQKSFLKSQIAHQDIPQDTAFFSALYKFAHQHKIKYILTGGNYSTECVREPEEWGAYPGIDVRFIKGIHEKFGNVPLKSFPLIDVFKSKLIYRYIYGMKVFKPLNFTKFNKVDAENFLSEKYGWKKFLHKHHESRFTRFFEDYWLPNKFGFDRRRAHFSSLILTGQMSRVDALKRVESPELEMDFISNEFDYIANKLDMPASELREIFEGQSKTINDYKNNIALINFCGKALTALNIERRLYK